MPFHIPNSRNDAQNLDAQDPLAHCRSKFKLPDHTIYLVGHSLGPAPFSALARVQTTAETEWADGLVGSWNSAGWIDLAQQAGSKLAPLLGVNADDVIICDSVSVNIFKLAAAALPLCRSMTIIIEDDEFPTDQYIAKGLSDLSDAEFHRVPHGQGFDALATGGVLIKSAVNYRSAEIIDIRAYEKKAQKSGALIIWDLSHATGIITLNLTDKGAKLAVGCTYKYLNGGPGAPAYIYAHPEIVSDLISPLPGWLGHKSPFAFERDYEPADGCARFVTGTPGILSLSAMSGALEVFDGVDTGQIMKKAQCLSEICLARADTMGLTSTSPRNPDQRAGHVSLLDDHGYPIVQALAARGIKSDFRTPDTIRFGFSPLFLRFVDVWDTMDALEDIVTTKSWDTDVFKHRQKVT
ncbi:MAG: hypothetical protein HKO02_08500 [Hyphomonadaceae bacterium]|nr:hypothetical protein [Hyphomonadaceae bacterium]